VRAARATLALVCLLLVFGAAEAAAQEPLRLSVSPARVSTRLGDSFQFSTRLTNRGTTRLSGLIAHLNVVGLTRSVYVDPEDWSASRTKYPPALGPGESARLEWKIKAVSGGKFAVYTVVLPESATASEPPQVSPAAQVHVTERRNLNPGGALPLAVGVPGALALLALGLRVRRRRSSGLDSA
jgi:hypothetical protein